MLEHLNNRPFKKLPGCRRSAFDALDRPALKPLPAIRYTYAEWKRCRVGVDYHVEIQGHYDSVPYRFARMELDARIAAHTIELFYKGRRMCDVEPPEH
ncbi:MAG: transposase [Betaproteobacteria bacterium]|nr:transposase [Betaproteobacteria bacterium]